MSRAAVFVGLKSMVPGVQFYANWSADSPPQKRGPFAILRWQEESPKSGMHRGPRILDIWIHIPIGTSRDHADIDPLLDQIKWAMEQLPGTTGTDGYTVIDVTCTGDGPDFLDTGYDSISRNTAFEILSNVVP